MLQTLPKPMTIIMIIMKPKGFGGRMSFLSITK